MDKELKLKKCSGKDCGYKPYSEFKSDNTQRDGLASICKECRKIISKKNYNKNIERNRRIAMERAHTIKGRFYYGKEQAKRKNREWSITLEEFSYLAELPCFYCYDFLDNNMVTCGAGLDRIDNLKGYVLNNVVPCCKTCNSIRGAILTQEETLIVVNSIINTRLNK